MQCIYNIYIYKENDDNRFVAQCKRSGAERKDAIREKNWEELVAFTASTSNDEMQTPVVVSALMQSFGGPSL